MVVDFNYATVGLKVTFENLSTGNAHALKACTSTYYWKRFHNPLYAFYKLSKRQADHCENRPYPFRRRQTRKKRNLAHRTFIPIQLISVFRAHADRRKSH